MTAPAPRDLYGWFDADDQVRPAYDPPHDAPCPYCGESLRVDDVRTESFVPAFDARRSYFFRMHRTCDDAADASARDRITEGVIARVEKELGNA